MCGWIKLHRDAMRSSLWANVKAWRLFEWCLMSASYEDRTVFVGSQPVHLVPGQMVFTLRNASIGTTLSQKEIRGALKVLEMGSQISLERAARFSLLTIVNWDTYQNDDGSEGSERAAKGQRKGSERAHFKEVKKQRSKEDISLQDENQCTDPDTKHPTSPLVDSGAANHSVSTLEAQTLNQEPRKRKQRVRSKEAQMVFDAWEYKRSDDKFDEQLDKNIAKRLKEGYTIEELLTCVKRAMPEEERTDPNYRKKASNFFGNAGYFKPYLDENFTEPEPTKVINDGKSVWDLLREQGLDVPTKYSDEDIEWIMEQEREFRKPKEAAVG